MRSFKLWLAAGSAVALAACDPAELAIRNATATPCAPCPSPALSAPPATPATPFAAPPSSRAQLMESAAVELDRQNVELRKVAAALAK